MNVEEIKAELKRLIEKRKTIDEKTSEANICATFVEPLFSLLGWNTLDIKQVDRQSYVRGAGYPDVALKLDNEPVIFVEVKKIGKIPKNRIDPQAQITLPLKELADLIDRTPEEKQAFKYARSEGIPWAILTNFDCLYVFNADQERIILSFKTPEEYLEKFDDLIQLSREKVKTKSLKWVQDQLKKEEMDPSFLEKLKNWRVTLAQNIYSENKDNNILKDDQGKFDLEKLMMIVQRVLSRMMIIQIADDREVLKQHNLLANIRETYENMGAYVTEDHLLKKFMELSEMMDKLHNTSIFTPGHPCDKVFISNGVLDKTIKELCNVSFRKMTADILGATYESYLGYKFDLKNGKIEAEIDQRVRKQAGIYYTPTYIVHYIVDNTLGVKLKELEDQYGLEAGEKAKDLKILDPACGSGSFLIYAFDVLAIFYERVNAKITEKQLELSKGHANSDMFERQEQFKHLPPRVGDYPKRILEDHLYGVDLDPAACEIATINLVIKAFEKIKDKKLPLILNQNVKVGNSLISGIEKREDLEKFKDEITEHIDLRRRLKEAAEDEEKWDLMKQIDQLRKKVNSQVNVSLKKYFDKPEEKRPFTWEFEFPEVFDSEKSEEQKGFDVVMGNPPYIHLRTGLLENNYKAYLTSFFIAAIKQWDIFELFTEKSINLLKEKGYWSFIMPRRCLSNENFEPLRLFLLSNSTLSFFLDCFMPFVEAGVEASILGAQKVLVKDSTIRIDKLEFQTPRFNQRIPLQLFESMPFHVYPLLNDLREIKLAAAIIDKGQKFGRLVTITRGIEAGTNDPSFLRKYRKGAKPVITGEDIERYKIKFNDWYVFPDFGDPSKYKTPEVYQKVPKILIRFVAQGIIAALDTKGYFNPNTVYNVHVVSSTNVSYLIGLLNSSLLNWWFKLVFVGKEELFPHVQKSQLEELPIHLGNTNLQKKIAALVCDMLVYNEQINNLCKIFEEVLANHSYELQPFGKAYYEKPEYIEKIDKKAEAIASSTDEVAKIFLEEKGNTLIFSVQLKDKNEKTLRLKIEDADFRLFLFYSIRKYLMENKRRKKWTTKSLQKVLDVILGRLEVPVFKSSGKIHDPRYNLRMINLVMKEFKTKFHKQFPKGNLHLSQIEEEIQDTDNSIDALVFKLYDLNKDEVTTVLDSMETPDSIKKDILKKFEAMK